MLSVYTSRINYNGSDRLDITRKGNDPVGVIFAPSWNLVSTYVQLRRVNKGAASEKFEAYTESYLAEMRRSYRQYRKTWNALLARDEITLVCYCTNPMECHRYIMGNRILPALGATFEGERTQQRPTGG